MTENTMIKTAISHVLIISPYRYLGDDIGSATFIHSQAFGLKKHISKIGVIAPSPKVYRGLNLVMTIKSFFTFWLDFKIEDGVSVIRFNGLFWMTSRIPFFSLSYWCLIGFIQYLIYVYKYGKPEIIHAHDSIYAGELALVLKTLFKIPVVITEHNSNLTENNTKYLVNKKRTILYKANLVLMVSDNLYKIHKEHECIVESKTFVVPNVLDPHREIDFEMKKNTRALGENFKFIHVSHMTKIKNLDSLLNGFTLFLKKYPSAELVLVGSGFYLEKLKLIALENGIWEKVKFVGRKNPNEIIEYYKESNVFILTSFYETFGYVLIEAMSMGLPVIAIKNSGGPDEIVNDYVGVLADSPGYEDVFKSMTRIYENYQDFNSVTIKHYCASKYSSEVVIPKIIKFYESIKN